MISSTTNEKIVSDFQKKVDSINNQKQLTFVEKRNYL